MNRLIRLIEGVCQGLVYILYLAYIGLLKTRCPVPKIVKSAIAFNIELARAAVSSWLLAS